MRGIMDITALIIFPLMKGEKAKEIIVGLIVLYTKELNPKVRPIIAPLFLPKTIYYGLLSSTYYPLSKNLPHDSAAYSGRNGIMIS